MSGERLQDHWSSGFNYATSDQSDKIFLLPSNKGHLCLWREDSLKEKYNTKYFKITFYLFSVYTSKFQWIKAYILAIVALFEAPYFGWHEHQRYTVAKYHDYGQLLYVLFL